MVRESRWRNFWKPLSRVGWNDYIAGIADDGVTNGASGSRRKSAQWNNPEETEKVFRDVWLKTGDIGFMNVDGFVTIVDRKKDMTLVSGFNVYPNEIESVVAAHPGVAECAAIGVPDEKSSKAGDLFVVRRGPPPHAQPVPPFAGSSGRGPQSPRTPPLRGAPPRRSRSRSGRR